MRARVRALRILAVLFLVLWCAAFLRMETTEKSMVQALVLWPEETGWTAGLVYQFPEAAADASDAAAGLQFCSASAQTLERAIREAGRSLPETANYRLCEYLLLGPGTTQETLLQIRALLETEPLSRLSARMFWLDGDEQPDAQLLLQAAEDAAPLAPRLYEAEKGILLPVLHAERDAVTLEKQALLLTETYTLFSPEETEMARLLLERKGERTFAMQDGSVCSLRRWVVSKQTEGAGFFVHLSIQRSAGTPPLSQAQCSELEALCVQTIRRCWENGYDLLQLGAVRALKQGNAAEPLTTKNACPEIRASVRCMEF